MGSTYGAHLLVVLVVVVAAPGAQAGVALCLQGMVVVGVVDERALSVGSVKKKKVHMIT